MIIVITIGRNIKNVPMNDFQWDDFKKSIELNFKELFVNAKNSGVWDGVIEESQVYMGIPHEQLSENDLENNLNILGNLFSQDAIGFVVNSRNSSLITCK